MTAYCKTPLFYLDLLLTVLALITLLTINTAGAVGIDDDSNFRHAHQPICSKGLAS